MKPLLPRLILVDDHVVVRNGLAELIAVMGNYKIIAQYNNGKDLMDAIPFIKSTPDLILMDLTMPVLDGEQTVALLKKQGYNIPVLILTLNTDESTILRLYRLGVQGYLPKDCTAVSLKEAIEDILNRGYHHSDALYKALMTDEPKPDKHLLEREAIIKKCTHRELQFLRLVCDEEEYTYEQIANDMCVSRRTVDGYREAIFDKFNIKSKTGLVLFAIKHNLF